MTHAGSKCQLKRTAFGWSRYRHLLILCGVDSGWKPQFARFLAIGLLNTLFGGGLFVLLIIIGLDKLLALLFATIIGVLFNFQTNVRIVFRTAGTKFSFMRFFSCYALSYVVNAWALVVLTNAELSPIAAQAIVILPVALLTFIVSRTWVFRKAPMPANKPNAGEQQLN